MAKFVLTLIRNEKDVFTSMIKMDVDRVSEYAIGIALVSMPVSSRT